MRTAKRASIFLLCFLTLPGAIFCGENFSGGKNKKFISSQQLLGEGQRHLNNSEYVVAEEKFDVYIDREPGDPVGYWLKIKAIYCRLRFEKKTDEPKLNDVEYAQLITLIDTGIEKSETKRYQEENNRSLAARCGSGDFTTDCTYVEAALYGLKGIFQKANGHVKLAYESAQRMKELAEKSKYQDARYLLGLAEYKLSTKTGFRGWLFRRGASLAGFPSDQREALQRIQAAAVGNRGPFVDDIRILMFKILTELKEKERKKAEEIFQISAQELFRELSAKYPNNERVQKYKQGLIQ